MLEASSKQIDSEQEIEQMWKNNYLKLKAQNDQKSLKLAAAATSQDLPLRDLHYQSS